MTRKKTPDEDIPPLYRLTRAELKAIRPSWLRKHRRAVKNILAWSNEIIRPEVYAPYPELRKMVCKCGNRKHESYHKCHNCYEVENRLEDYLRSQSGQKFVLDCLLKRGCLAGPDDFNVNARW